MNLSRLTIAVLVAASLLAVASPAAAQPDRAALAIPMNMDGRGTMVGGYDVVAYFDYGEPTPGVPDYFFDYLTTFRFRFASKVTMKKFQSDPEHYMPAYGGFCAYSLAKSPSGNADLQKTDPTIFKIIDDRLYLFSSAEALEAWNKDEAAALERANANWDAVVAARQQQ